MHALSLPVMMVDVSLIHMYAMAGVTAQMAVMKLIVAVVHIVTVAMMNIVIHMVTVIMIQVIMVAAIIMML